MHPEGELLTQLGVFDDVFRQVMDQSTKLYDLVHLLVLDPDLLSVERDRLDMSRSLRFSHNVALMVKLRDETV